MRIKKGNTYSHQFKSGLIRKSLKTSDYKVALERARLLWVQYNMTQDDKNFITEVEYESQLEREGELYSRGKEIHQMYEELDHNDTRLMDDFCVTVFGSGQYSEKFDREAYLYYVEKNEKSFVNNNVTNVTHNSSNIHSKPLKSYIDEFLYDKEQNHGNLNSKSLGKTVQNLTFFCWCMNNCPLNEITSHMVKSRYIDVLTKIPAHIKRHKDLLDKEGNMKPIDFIINYTEKKGLDKLSNNTRKGKLTYVSEFIQWCIDNDYLDDKVIKPFSVNKKIKKDSKKRFPFSEEDLKKLFNNPIYYKGLYHYKYNFRHWIPLIALYSGMRVNEICQLRIRDVKLDKETNIYYMHLREGSERQSVKSDSSHRKVPIHKTLIKLGFINFYKLQKSKRNINEQLFEKLSYHKSNNNHSSKIVKWFSNYTVEIGLRKNKKVEKVFHSFRHTFINFEKQNRLDREIIEEIVGHASNRTVHNDYQQGFSIQAKKREIDKIEFDIDIDKFKVFK